MSRGFVLLPIFEPMPLLIPKFLICASKKKSYAKKEAKEMFQNYPDVVSIAQLQKMLSVGRNTAYALLKENKIQSIRIGKIHKIPKINVIKYLQIN